MAVRIRLLLSRAQEGGSAPPPWFPKREGAETAACPARALLCHQFLCGLGEAPLRTQARITDSVPTRTLACSAADAWKREREDR